MAGARDQLTRMLALVPYLQRGQDISLQQVATEFHVRPADIMKDLRVLWYCGLPGLSGGSMIDIDFESFEDDPDGIVRLGNADYLSRPMRLDSTQAASLIVALRTLRDGSAGEVVATIDGVLAKLENATSEGESLPITAAGTNASERSARLTEIRAQLGTALDQDRQVEISYYVPARDEVTQRRIEPQRLLEREGHSYLEAWCHAAQAQRLFRVDRIDGVRMLEDVRSRPTPEKALASEIFQASASHTLVGIHASPRGRWAADYYPIESATESPDGGLDITMRVADRHWLFRTLLGMAPQARIVQPTDWAAEFAGRVADIVALYQQGDAS